MHLRSAEDSRWQEVKRIVKERDNMTCRCCRCMTIKERAIKLENSNPAMLKPTDCAHSAAATFSTHPETRYDPDHIFFLCRSCHSNIDSHHSPVDGSVIQYGLNEEYYWWYRIKSGSTESFNTEIDYESKYNNLIIAEDSKDIQDLISRYF